MDRALADVGRAGTDSREQLTLRVATMADLALDGPLRGAALAIDGVEVSVSSGRGDDALEAVRQGRAGAAIVWSRSPPQRDLAGVVPGSVVFGVVLPLAHALSGAARVPVTALADEVLVMFPREPFAGIWDRAVDHVFPARAARDQVVIEPDLLNAPKGLLRAVGAGTGIALSILGLVDHLGVEGVTVRPLDPALRWDLEAVWRAPASPAVRRLVDFLADSSRGPQTLVEPVRRPGDGRRDVPVRV